MKEYILKIEAIKLLLRFFISCSHPLMRSTPEGKAHEKYTFLCLQKGIDLSLRDFLKGLGQEPEVYTFLAWIADKLGKAVIDIEVVFRYFGGAIHIDKVWNDMLSQKAQRSINQTAQSQFLFLHQCLLAVVKNIRMENERVLVSAVYRLDNREVVIDNLAVFKEDSGEIAIGTEVLAHFGTVISTEIPVELRNFFLKEQSDDQRFLSALEVLDRKRIKNHTLAQQASATMEDYGL